MAKHHHAKTKVTGLITSSTVTQATIEAEPIVTKPHIWLQPSRPRAINRLDNRKAQEWLELYQGELTSSYRCVNSVCTYGQWLDFVSRHSSSYIYG